MDKEIAISVRDLKKTFKIPQDRSNTMKQTVLSIFKKKKIFSFEVLKGISFDVKKGEFFGIIGRNGCGKSTLLKMLAGIYVPDSGVIEISGRISPFLELGVGFNPELTGYENIYLNGAILGLSKNEIAAKMDEIIDFSELSEFMDQKLKNYSSGMQVRLAFSVAIHAHAPIILLDEVLAVGDARFQQKCRDVFVKLKKEKRTIIFVTHSMDLVKEFCDRAILISEGKILLDGSPVEVAQEYGEINEDRKLSETNNHLKQFNFIGSHINSKQGVVEVKYGEDLNLALDFDFTGKIKNVYCVISLYSINDDRVGTFSSRDKLTYTLKKNFKLRVNLGGQVAPGQYRVAASIIDKKLTRELYGNTNMANFIVTPPYKIIEKSIINDEWK